MTHLHSWKGLGIGFFFVIGVDQLSKFIAQLYGLVSFNNGFSFGLGGFLPLPMIVAVVLLTLMIWMKWVYSRKILSPLLVGAFSGAVVSNLFDRLCCGGVRDFLPLPLVGVSNNLADWVIGLTLVWIVYKELT